MYFGLLKNSTIEEYKIYINEYGIFAKKYNKKVILIIENNLSKENKDYFIQKYPFITFVFFDDLKDSPENIDKIYNIIKKYYKKGEIFIIPGVNDNHGILVNNLYKKLGKAYTENTNIFLYKDQLRNLLAQKIPENTINFYILEKNSSFSDIKKRVQNFSFPFILKPTKGAGSKTVFFLNNFDDLEKALKIIKNNKKTYQIEEFITGKMYSVDFFVKENGDFNMLPIFRVSTSKELGLYDDFANIFVYSEKNFPYYNLLQKFIKKISKIASMKNQFCHLEFYITKLGELKIIEINGRIGGKRLYIYSQMLGKSFLDLTINTNNIIDIDYKKYILSINLYHFDIIEKGKWKYNEKLISKVGEKNLFIKIIKEGQEKIGSSKLGFGYPAIIILRYNSEKEMKKGLIFLKNNYNNFILKT